MSEASPFTPNPSELPSLERAIEAAEADVKRAEQAVLDAEGADAEQAARDALTGAELRLYELLDQRTEGCACEGWPRGK